MPPSKPAAKSSVAKEKVPLPPLSDEIVGRPPIASVWQISRRASLLFWRHKQLFLGIALVTALLNLLLAQGFASVNVDGLKAQLGQALPGPAGSAAVGFLVYVNLIGSSSGSTSNSSAAYQLFLTLIGSLAIIWALRQSIAGATVRIRDAFYQGMYPLVPFLLTILLIGVQLIPLVVGAVLFATVISKGIAVLLLEKVLWGLLFVALAVVSLYMLSSTLIALYIVTLPAMTPLKAVRSARELVRGRRWTIMRKVLFLPCLFLLVSLIIMLPVIAWAAPVATYVFFLLSSLALPALHFYMYGLYRELLNE